MRFSKGREGKAPSINPIMRQKAPMGGNRELACWELDCQAEVSECLTS